MHVEYTMDSINSILVNIVQAGWEQLTRLTLLYFI
jgi:hypothetical protein